jgi:HAD superfamily phosphatase (TIGR01668 family)
MCLVSNNWHERVTTVADELGLPMVSKAVKPLPFAFLKALGILDARPQQTAVIGDQLFTDIVGGNLIGARTVLVEPLSRTDLPHTLLLRRMEARIMAGREPVGEATLSRSDGL